MIGQFKSWLIFPSKQHRTEFQDSALQSWSSTFRNLKLRYQTQISREWKMSFVWGQHPGSFWRKVHPKGCLQQTVWMEPFCFAEEHSLGMWMWYVLGHLVSWGKTLVRFTDIYLLHGPATSFLPGLGGISMGLGAGAALPVLPTLICLGAGCSLRRANKAPCCKSPCLVSTKVWLLHHYPSPLLP